jgi:L-amino acid N-acyltransferase YncA
MKHPSSDVSDIRYLMWPMLWDEDTGEYSVPDEVLIAIWDRIVETGAAKELCHDGAIKTVDAWLNHIKAPDRFPILICDVETMQPLFLAWIAGMGSGCGLGHFVGVERYKRTYGRMIMQRWREMQKPDGTPYFRAIYGFTPAMNERALRLAKSLGFVECGRLPAFSWMEYKGKVWCDTVITYLSFENRG